MDRLPKRKELVFNRARKTLYLRLTTVIRSISTNWPVTQVGADEICATIINLGSMVEPFGTAFVSREAHRLPCILAEILKVKWDYRFFLVKESGDRTHTRKLEAGIARLEWLRDNWDDLEITGDLKHGYKLVLESNKS